MRIPYLNTPCILNETCFHGDCIHIEDFLLGWYEFCLCHSKFFGIECNEQTKLTRLDWFIILVCLLGCLFILICSICIPYFYKYFQDDFYPQIIECKRSTPYVEYNSRSMNGIRIYRIPSEHLTHRRTIIDGLIPLHRISSLAYLNHFRNIRFQTSNIFGENTHT